MMDTQTSREQSPGHNLDHNAAVPNDDERLSPPELRELLRNPAYLPTRQQITDAFKDASNPRIALFDFCTADETNQKFEILNVEFIDALADYICQRALDFGVADDTQFRVLEVGAGDGRLTHFLRERIQAIRGQGNNSCYRLR